MTTNPTPDIRVGDVVTVGKSKKQWRVDEFFGGWPEGAVLARLEPIEGYSNTSVDADRLNLVTRPIPYEVVDLDDPIPYAVTEPCS